MSPTDYIVSPMDHCFCYLKFGKFSKIAYIVYMDIAAFWKRVKFRLKEKKVSQSAAAKVIGIPPATFRGWMSKGRIPPSNYAYKLSRFLGVSLDFLVTGREYKKAAGKSLSALFPHSPRSTK